jgi:hypothetical protein
VIGAIRKIISVVVGFIDGMISHLAYAGFSPRMVIENAGRESNVPDLARLFPVGWLPQTRADGRVMLER